MNRLFVVVCVMVLAGCSGPTKSGKEARVLAHLRMDAMNANLAAQQAKQQFEVGQLEAALETIDAAIARYRDNADYHLLRGRVLLEQHRLDAAFKTLKEATRLNPADAKPHYFLGILQQRWSEDEEALESYKKAMECDSTHPQYLLATAETYVAIGKHEEAIQLLVNAGKEFRHQPGVTALLGHIYLTQGNATKASELLEESRLLGNDDTEILTNLSIAQFQSASYTDCLVTLAQLQEEIKTPSPFFQRLKAKCLAATGRLIQGRDLCLKITRQSPEDVGAWVDLGYISWEMGDYERVDRCGQKISQLAPDVREGPLFEGIAAMHVGDITNAQQKLAIVQSYNDIAGVDQLLQYIANNTKSGPETPITPNMQAKTAEGASDPRSKDPAEGSQPLAGVSSDSLHVP